MLTPSILWSFPPPGFFPAKHPLKPQIPKKKSPSTPRKPSSKTPKPGASGTPTPSATRWFLPFPFRPFPFVSMGPPISGASSPPVVSQKTAVKRILATVAFIQKNLKTSHYQGLTRVNTDEGKFNFDCSGMVGWILQGTAPQALSEVNANMRRKQSRPIVANFVKTLQSVSPLKPTAGWRRVFKLEDARPGDVIAWPTPSWYPSDASGHMGIVVETPVKVKGGYLVRIADSTSYPHGNDTRNGGSGFGYGTVFITVDPKTGAGNGQGWTGLYSTTTVIRTPILVGRPLK